MSALKLPVSPKTLLENIGLFETESAKEINISLLVDISLGSEFVAYAKSALHPQHQNLRVAVQPYFAEAPELEPYGDLVIILAAEAPATGALLSEALGEQVPAVIVTLDPLRLEQIARDNYYRIEPRQYVTVSDQLLAPEAQYRQVFHELGKWIVRSMPELRLSFARALPFVRRPFADDAIMATSVQNAAISAVFFLPGADMPLLTLNQAKLFLQIAAAHGVEMGAGMLKELALLLASGFGLRAIARKLVGLVPVFGWAMRGAVGFSGTMAIGKASLAYFEAGGDIAEIAKKLIDAKDRGGEDSA